MKLLTHDQFQADISLLLEETKFSPSLKMLRMIFYEVKNLSRDQFTKVCDQIIFDYEGGYKKPVAKMFRKYAEPFTTINRDNEKEEHRLQYSDFFTSEQFSMITTGLIKSIKNKDNALFKKIHDGLKPMNKSNCKHCSDTGLVWVESVDVAVMGTADRCFNCFCNKSRNDTRFDTWGARFDATFKNKSFRDIDNIY